MRDRVIRIQQVESAEIECVVSGDRGEVGVQLVVCFGKQAAVRIGEDAGELTHQPLELRPVPAVENDGQGEFAKRLAIAESPQAIAQILDIDLLRLIHQDISRIGFCRVVAQLRNEACLRNVEMAAAFVDFLPSLVRCEGRPLRDNDESCRRSSAERPAPAAESPDGLLHRQYADEMIADAQIVTFCLDVGIRDLVIEKLGALRWPAIAPIVDS